MVITIITLKLLKNKQLLQNQLIFLIWENYKKSSVNKCSHMENDGLITLALFGKRVNYKRSWLIKKEVWLKVFVLPTRQAMICMAWSRHTTVCTSIQGLAYIHKKLISKVFTAINLTALLLKIFVIKRLALKTLFYLKEFLILKVFYLLIHFFQLLVSFVPLG